MSRLPSSATLVHLPMAVSVFLDAERSEIVDAAVAQLGRAHARHYEAAGELEQRRRIEALFDDVRNAVARRQLGSILEGARSIARERYSAGYDLSEVQTAFNALEESVWHATFLHAQPAQYSEILGLTTTVLGAAKDALAREYVSLATRSQAPSLDVTALFAGTERESTSAR